MTCSAQEWYLNGIGVVRDRGLGVYSRQDDGLVLPVSVRLFRFDVRFVILGNECQPLHFVDGR